MITLNFDMLGDIADVIISDSFVNLFRGFGVLTLPILVFSIGFVSRPYNITLYALVCLCYNVMCFFDFLSDV